MPDNQNLFQNPLVAFMLLMVASTPDPSGRLNELGRAITSMQDAVRSINTGMEMFHNQVIPMFQQRPDGKNK